jgi:hypothetical protein
VTRSDLKESQSRSYRRTNLLGENHYLFALRYVSSRGGRFDITPGGQQVHIAFGENDLKSRRHPCFKIESPQTLLKLRRRIWEHFEKADKASPQEADKPGEEDSGMFSSFSSDSYNF